MPAIFSFTAELKDELFSLVDRVAEVGDSSDTGYNRLTQYLDRVQKQFNNAYTKARTEIDTELTGYRSSEFNRLYDRCTDCWGYHSYQEWADHVKSFDFTTIGLTSDQLELL